MTTFGKTKIDIDVQPILKGQVATFEAEGGFIRRPAPCDGLWVEQKSGSYFLPLKAAEAAIASLKRHRAREKQDEGRDAP